MAGDSTNWNNKVILIKAETTEGTDAGPTVTTDAIRVLNLQPTFMDADQKVRALEKAYFGADPVTMAAFKRGATFSMEIAGSGTKNVPPPWMAVLQFCGFGAPVAGVNNVVQNPTTANTGSATFWQYIDDLRLKAVGTRGSVGFVFEDDEFPLLNFNLLGRPPAQLASQNAPGTPTIPATYQDPLLAATENTTITWNGYAYGVRRLTMSDNAQLQYRSLINPQDRVLYSGRSWSGELVIEVGNLTASDPFAGIRAGATSAASVVHGAGNGKIVQVDMPRLQVTGNVTLSEEQGKTMATIPVSALPTAAGNDEVTFTTS